MRKIEVGLCLECGCCGTYFKTREGYIDQDQDNDYGICKECQGEAEERTDEQYESNFKKVYDSMSDKNKKKIDAFLLVDPNYKIQLVNWAIDKGFLTREITRNP